MLQLLLLLLSVPPLVQCDIFTNPFSIKAVFLAENRLVKEMKSVHKLAQEGSQLKDMMASYLTEHKTVEDEVAGLDLSQLDPDDYDDRLMTEVVGNAVHVYRMCSRVNGEMDKIVKKMKEAAKSATNSAMKKQIKSFLQKLKQEKSRVTWCETEDLQGTGFSLTRVGYTYVLPAISFARGFLGEKSSLARLSSEDCGTIAEDRMSAVMSNGPEYALAIEWMEAAMELLEERSPGKVNQKKQALKKRMLEVRGLHDQNFVPPTNGDGPSDVMSEFFFVRPIGQDLRQTGFQLRLEEDEMFRTKRHSTQREGFAFNARDFMHLCRGLKLHRPDNRGKLGGHCFLTTRGEPYLALMPLKVEILSEEPVLRVYHDLVSDKEIDFIKRTARAEFKTGVVEDTSKAPGATMRSNSRTQSTGWLSDISPGMQALDNLSKRLTMATGLDVARTSNFSRSIDPMAFIEAEPFQVGIYGPGGLYLPHVDAFHKDGNSYFQGVWVGNRIATVMVYLSDDVLGGKTAFPQMGVAASPNKGSAAFWYSLSKAGSMDWMSLHGACPTIFGIKWVTNKWIREGSQVFKRPCGMEMSEGITMTGP